MGERYLITQTLLNAWGYTFDCAESCRDDAMADFIATLNREKREPTKAMLDGIAFETAVYAEAHHQPRREYPKWENGIKRVAAYIGNAPVQVKAQRELEVDGQTFLVYGILDALSAGVILDVKFSSKSFANVELAGKYLNSAQHSAYFYVVPEAHQFQYVVSDGEDMYIETYCREDAVYIGDIVHNFMQSLDLMGLTDVYKEKWLAL